MKVPVKVLRKKLERMLEDLSWYEDEDFLITQPNTYFTRSDYFVSLGQFGYAAMDDLRFEENEELEEDDEDGDDE